MTTLQSHYKIGSRRLSISYETHNIVFYFFIFYCFIRQFQFIYISPSKRLGEEYYFIQNLID